MRVTVVIFIYVKLENIKKFKKNLDENNLSLKH